MFAKEWKNLKAYQKETKRDSLILGEWLTKDRKQNSITWQNANAYNLSHLNSEAYTNVGQRLGFYRWIEQELKQKGNEIHWVIMAGFISDKLSKIGVFPYKYFVKKSTIYYTNIGSEVVFKNALPYLKNVLGADEVLKGEAAETWDLEMLHREQYEWVESVYSIMDAKSLEQISEISKGNGIYGLFVPNELEFTGDLKNAEDRYLYAVNVLLPYCKSLD